MTLDLVRRAGARGPSARRLGAHLKRIGRDLRLDGGAVTLLLCDDREMSRLNGAMRGQEVPTDVLAFPAGEALPGEPATALGDIAISWETAARQSAAAGRTLDREILVLLTHGLLHLLGYDHESDDGEMLRLQARLLAGGR